MDYLVIPLISNLSIIATLKKKGTKKMTLKEKVAMEDPDMISVHAWGGVNYCPRDYEYLPRYKSLCPNLDLDGNPEKCTRCWDQDILGTEGKSERNIIDIVNDMSLMRLEAILRGYDWLKTENEALKAAVRDEMTANEYQQLALRTCPVELRVPDCERSIVHGVMGLNGEAGEAIDILKKVMYQGHEFDANHLAKELGDVAWYLAVTANAIGYSLEDIFKMNIEKLKARYPDGFDTEKSTNRAEDDI